MFDNSKRLHSSYNAIRKITEVKNKNMFFSGEKKANINKLIRKSAERDLLKKLFIEHHIFDFFFDMNIKHR